MVGFFYISKKNPYSIKEVYPPAASGARKPERCVAAGSKVDRDGSKVE
jgi:hypothetical protein